MEIPEPESPQTIHTATYQQVQTENCPLEEDESDDDTMWFCYWLICAFLLAFESLCSFIVASFPFYFELKYVVLCFLQADTAKLSFQLFNKFIEPLLTSVEPQIDAFLDKYSQQAVSITHSANEQLHKEIANIAVQQALEKMNS